MKQKNKRSSSKMFLRKEWSNLAIIAGVLLLAVFVVGRSVLAEEVPHPTEAEQEATDLMVAAMTNSYVNNGHFPKSEKREFIRKMAVISTAYSSDESQTDSTPFITASGSAVRHGVIAANFLPIGTKIKIPDLYGNEFFIVEDRMNARYSDRVDIWMETYQEAKRYGVRRITIEVYE